MTTTQKIAERTSFKFGDRYYWSGPWWVEMNGTRLAHTFDSAESAQHFLAALMGWPQIAWWEWGGRTGGWEDGYDGAKGGRYELHKGGSTYVICRWQGV